MPVRPGWLAKAPREERAKRGSPSSLVEHFEEGGAGLGRGMALTRGSAVHLLLETLTDRPKATRHELANRLLAHRFPDLPDEITAGVLTEALAVFDAPFADTIFGPGSLAEAGMALELPAISETRMLGRIDRLVIGPERVLVVDFKTDAQPTAVNEELPEGYLLQLGCYRAAIAAIYPEHVVDAAILWTAGPVLMSIDGVLLDKTLAERTARRP